MPSSFSHCSRYSVTGKRPNPYTESPPFSLTLRYIGPRAAGFFNASFSARRRSSSAFISSSDAIVFKPVIQHPGAMLRWNFPRMPEFEAILFDFDGVLLDSEPVHWACWAELLASVGLTLTWEYYRDYCIGIDDRDMLRDGPGRPAAARLEQSLGAISGQEEAVPGTHGSAAFRAGTGRTAGPTARTIQACGGQFQRLCRDRTAAGGRWASASF